MILEDLEYIFGPEIDEGTTNLYFMLIDGEHRVIERHNATAMARLVPLLDNFQYAGTRAGMPRFTK
jgi:hypothetical protein